MKSQTRLDSAVFQLTPTRTRYDLVIRGNGKTEKIASGLLDPFLSHLKTAKDQIAKGGYSITLEAEPGTDATWFTKGTVERFVRFVSTPEVLERVNTIEAEILQIDDAIAIQSNENLGCSSGEVQQRRSISSVGGSKPLLDADADADKAIVLFKPGVHQPESNGSTTHEENSKVQLLKVLETRKIVLQKEQGMAFARAVAAGFDMDHLTHLILFAECFGATRLMDACLNFVELWKRKHETGQWVEVEAADATPVKSDLSSINPSVITLSGEASGPLGTESNGKMTTDAGADANSQYLSLDQSKARKDRKSEEVVELIEKHLIKSTRTRDERDKRPQMDSQVPLSPQDHFQEQFPHPLYPHWPIHTPLAAPVFQPYPMQGMPYYQNYPGTGPFFPTLYPPVDDPRLVATQRNGQNKHSVDSKNNNANSGTLETVDSNGKSPDGTNLSTLDLEKDALPRKKGGQAGKKQSRMVVIRNINYITSKKHDTSGTESSSASEPETDEEAQDSNSVERKNKTSSSSEGKVNRTKSENADYWSDEIGIAYGRKTDVSNWQAFQNCLMRLGVDKGSSDREMFSAEKEVPAKRHLGMAEADPILPRQDPENFPEQRVYEPDNLSGKSARMHKESGSAESVISHGGRHPNGRGGKHNKLDVQFPEIEGRGRGYRKGSNDDFMIYGRRNHPDIINFHTHNFDGNDSGYADNMDNGSSHNVADESFVVPLRSSSQDQVASSSRTAIDMDSQFSSALDKTENSDRFRGQLNYEPNDLNLMPRRGTEGESFVYNPAADYEMQAHAGNTFDKKKGLETSVKQASKKLDKEKKSRMQEALEKRNMGSLARKGKPSKLTPQAEAQARAERLRAFKADLQKLKKEKEEEEIKRLEALKRERQQRIAARSSSSPAQTPLPSLQTRSRLPAKLSPGLQKASKFSDSEPGSSSPLQKLPIRRTSLGSNDSPRTTKTKELNSSRLVGSGLSRSVSSLQELKKENEASMTESPEPKAVSLRTRRLSDPKSGSSHRASLLKSGSNKPAAKTSLSDEPEVKNIAAIMNLDKTKSATLPELRIRTYRGNSGMAQNKSAMKEKLHKGNGSKSSVPSENEKMQKGNGSKSSVPSESEKMQKGNGSKSSLPSENVKPKKTDEKTLHPGSHADDNPVVEKTVLTLEREMRPIPVVQASEVMMGTDKGPLDAVLRDKGELVARNPSGQTKTSSITFHGVDQDPSECQLDVKSGFREMQATRCVRDEPSKSPKISVIEKPYQAPYARASSLEDPCTRNLEYSKAPPIISDMAATTETVKAHVPNFTEGKALEQIPEVIEKPRDKESSKGFKRFLKFGRKMHSPAAGDHSYDSDKLDIEVADDQAAITSSREVHKLKNLISQDDSSSVGTPHKVSRYFSLLSPLRSKTSEKKLAT